MTPAARSVFVFGVYVVVVGILVTFAPAEILRVLQFPPAADEWIRMVGILSLVIGAYDIVSGRSNAEANIRASVPIRVGFAVCCCALVGLRLMPPQLLLLAAIDVAGAVWTALALRGSRSVAEAGA
ncbi:MAG TPA: hypothetical protein VE974_20550 [Thermoanaerobaculia bacterium]|nr:hypothetical protein [Thermoanaerobaculia bacterium]